VNRWANPLQKVRWPQCSYPRCCFPSRDGRDGRRTRRALVAHNGVGGGHSRSTQLCRGDRACPT